MGDDLLLIGDTVVADVQLSSEYEIQKAKITLLDSDRAKINLFEPNFRVAPGQACVIYENDKVLGGGWISENLSVK